MNLKLTLILRIVGAAALCLLGVGAYVIWQSGRDLERNMASTADFAARQLEQQLWHIAMGFERIERFPEWQPSPALESAAGLCVDFVGVDGRVIKSQCTGWTGNTPEWFTLLHKRAFGVPRELTRNINYRDTRRGKLMVTSNPDMAAAQAWRDVRGLIGLQLASVLAVGGLIYGSVRRALQPADAIMTAFSGLERGDLSVRLPPFQLAEFRRIGEGFNSLVAHLQVSIQERNHLTTRLFQVQEEERRALARDLHDEFGQCLAGISALTASINETARRERPDLLREGEAIARTCEHMMGMLRETLVRLRPPEIELGLTDSLQSLAAGWNDRLSGKTRFTLEVVGDVDGLPGVVAVNIFRIVQECLTNASRHAGAAEVRVKLERSKEAGGDVILTIEDDGKAGEAALSLGGGVGLLGVRERITAMGGVLNISLREPSGLRVRALVPDSGSYDPGSDESGSHKEEAREAAQ
jgi:two-component system, NarL family, sensor histidine kinase UhpB